MKTVAVTGQSIGIDETNTFQLYLANSNSVSSMNIVGATGLGGLWALDGRGKLFLGQSIGKGVANFFLGQSIGCTLLKQTCAAQESPKFFFGQSIGIDEINFFLGQSIGFDENTLQNQLALSRILRNLHA